MPHLSPMNWIMVPLIMMSLLVVLMTIMWWQFMPIFPSSQDTQKGTLTSKIWHWW